MDCYHSDKKKERRQWTDEQKSAMLSAFRRELRLNLALRKGQIVKFLAANESLFPKDEDWHRVKTFIMNEVKKVRPFTCKTITILYPSLIWVYTFFKESHLHNIYLFFQKINKTVTKKKKKKRVAVVRKSKASLEGVSSDQ